MKISSEYRKEFTPIEIGMVIESKQELVELWKRLNLPSATVDDGNKGEFDSYTSTLNGVWELWKMLDDILEFVNS